ncbi:MAG: mandelate racemase/muconate lactonizing enzyme family protein [Chloroflexota bacterium]
MRITNIEVFLLYDRFVYVKVDTDEGIAGWGEAAFHGGKVTAQTLQALGEKVIGRDPFQTDALWQELFRTGYRIGSTGAHMASIGALDIAFHDIKGKALNTPIYNLLGGKFRDRVPVYSSLMERHLPPAQDVEKIHKRMEQGYSWVKLHTATGWALGALDAQSNDGTIATVTALRKECGDVDKLKILVDVNQAYTVDGALWVGRALDELQVSHFEEPIAPWDFEGYNRLQAALDTPLAAGEQEYNLWQFRDLITRANMDILQPNITSCGGYTQGMKIAALAETFNRPITCHNTDPALMTVAHLHLWATCQSCIYPQEYFGEDAHPLRDRTPVLKTPLEVVDGHIAVPDGPGLGVEIDERMVRKIAAGEVL